MSGVVLAVVGLVLCFAGARSLRLAVTAAGFGLTWLVCDLLDTTLTTALLASLAGAVLVLALSLVLARFLLLAVGALVGAAIGAKLLLLLEQGEANLALAALFVPAVAVVCAVLANRFRRTFVVWATAFGGASVTLSGLGVAFPTALGDLRLPDDTSGQVLLTVAWLALALTGGTVQAQRVPARR